MHACVGTVGYRPTSSGTEKQTCYNAAGGIVPMSTTRDTVGEFPFPTTQQWLPHDMLAVLLSVAPTETFSP